MRGCPKRASIDDENEVVGSDREESLSAAAMLSLALLLESDDHRRPSGRARKSSAQVIPVLPAIPVADDLDALICCHSSLSRPLDASIPLQLLQSDHERRVSAGPVMNDR